MNRTWICGAVAALLLAAPFAHATDTKPALSLRDAADRVREAIKKEKAGQPLAALHELTRVLRALKGEEVKKLDAMAKVAHNEAVTDRVFRLRLGCKCPEAHKADCLLKCKRCGGTGQYEGQTCPGCAGSGKVVCHRCGGTGLLLTYPTPYEMQRLLAHYLQQAKTHLTAAADSFQKVTVAGDASLDEHSGIHEGTYGLIRATSWLDEAGRFRRALDEGQRKRLDAAVTQQDETEDKAAAALLTVNKAARDEFDTLMKTFKDDKTPRDRRLTTLRRMVELNGLADTFYRIVEIRYPRGFSPHKEAAAEVAGRRAELVVALETVERRDALLASAVRDYRRKRYADCVGTLERLAKYANAVELKEMDALCEKAVKRTFAELMGRARFYGLAAGQDCGRPTELDAAAFVETGLRLWDRGVRRVQDDLTDLDRKADDRLRRIESGVSPGNKWPALRKKAESNIKQLRKMARFMNEYYNKAARAADRQRIPRMMEQVRRLQDHWEDIERKFSTRPEDEPVTP